MRQAFFLLFLFNFCFNLIAQSQCPALSIQNNNGSGGVCSPVSGYSGIQVGLPNGSSIGVASISGLGTFSSNGTTYVSSPNIPNGGSLILPAIDWNGVGTATISVTIYGSDGVTALGCGSIDVNLHGTLDKELSVMTSLVGVAEWQQVSASTGFDNYDFYVDGNLFKSGSSSSFRYGGVRNNPDRLWTCVASGSCIITKTVNFYSR